MITYVIQAKMPRPSAQWTDYQPLADGLAEQQRLDALEAWRQSRTSKAEYRLVKRTVTEEVVA
jgi:hypothetical protein